MRSTDDVGRARVALHSLSSTRAEDRNAWIRVGMALHSVSDELFDDWDAWSRQSDKYDAADCRRQWRSFKRKSRGINLGSLMHWAREDSGSLPGPSHADEYEPRSDPRNPPAETAEPVAVTPDTSASSFPDFTEAAQSVARRENRKLTRIWLYPDSTGVEDFAVARFDPLPDASGKAAKKSFRPFHRTSDGWRLGDPPGPLPLYQLPDLLARSNEVVFVVEGEKCADAMRLLGFLATTSAHGSSSSNMTDWSPLAGRNVIVIPDNDPSGRQYAAAVTILLTQLSTPAAVSRADLVGLRKGGDIFDLIEMLRAEGLKDDAIRAEIQRRLADSKSLGVKLIRASSVTTKAVAWLWSDRIPIGKLTLITGDPDVGKTLVLLDVIARFTRGTAMPGCSEATTPAGSVVYVAAEDDPADTIVPRLKAARADLDRVHFIDLCVHSESDRGEPKTQFFSLDHIQLLEARLDRDPELRLIALDPITAFMGDTDTHRDADVRACLLKLQELAARRQITIVAIQHLNKGAGANAKQRVTGSLAFVAVARSVLIMGRHPEDTRLPNESARRVLARTKANLTKRDESILYTISSKPLELADGSITEVPVVVWGETTKVQADDLVQTPPSGPTKKVDSARDALEEALAEGPIGTDEVSELAESIGVSSRTMERAAKDLGVDKSPIAFGQKWKWTLPPERRKSAKATPSTGELADSGSKRSIVISSTSELASAYDPLLRVRQVIDDRLADSGPLADSAEPAPPPPAEEPTPPSKKPRAKKAKRESSSSDRPRAAKLRQRSIEELLDAVPLNVTAVAPESAKLVGAEPTPESTLADTGEEPRKPSPIGDSDGSRPPEITSVCQIPVSQGLADSAEARVTDAAPVIDTSCAEGAP